MLVCPSRKLTLFITKFHWTFVSKRKLNEIAPFLQRNFCSKSLKLSLELSHGISTKVHKHKKRNSRISLALLLHSTVHLIFVSRRWGEYCWTISKEEVDAIIQQSSLSLMRITAVISMIAKMFSNSVVNAVCRLKVVNSVTIVWITYIEISSQFPRELSRFISLHQ